MVEDGQEDAAADEAAVLEEDLSDEERRGRLARSPQVQWPVDMVECDG
jgi:hypothetical protein